MSETGVISDYANIGYFVLSYVYTHTCKGRIYFSLAMSTCGIQIIFTYIIITEEILRFC